MKITDRRLGLALAAAVALVTVGCGRGETTVRPFVKRGGDGAEKTAAEKTAAEKTAAAKAADAPSKTGKTNGS
jgi:hypothetical protein